MSVCMYGSSCMTSNISLQIDIVGHSGDSPDIKFVSSAAPPSNDKERLNVLEVHTSTYMCLCVLEVHTGTYMCLCVHVYVSYNTVLYMPIHILQC